MNTEELTFEDALLKLENIVRELEAGRIKLDDAVTAYTQAVNLKNFCEQKLKDAQLKIEKIENSRYTLVNDEGVVLDIKLKFYGLTQNPNKGDYIYINDALLDPKYKEYSKSYYFGPLDEPYGRKVTENDIDFLTLDINGNKVNLKRFYG